MFKLKYFIMSIVNFMLILIPHLVKYMKICSSLIKLKILTARFSLTFLVLWILLIKRIIENDYNFDIIYKSVLIRALWKII